MFYQAFTGKQPPKSFVADLTRPMHGEIRNKWNRRKAEAGEIFLSSLSLSFSFPDPEGLLESSYKDFREFLKSAKIKEGDGLPLRLRQEDLGQFEGYSIEISAKEICITAGDTEGIRRAQKKCEK